MIKSQKKIMMLGIWEEWHPLKSVTGEFGIKAYSNNFFEFRIILSKRNSKTNTEMHVSWQGLIETYRVMNETYRGRLWHYLYNVSKDVDLKWPLFRVKQSEYLKFLSEESEGITDELNFKHYFIVDGDMTIDVGSRMQPRIELFVSEKLVEFSASQWH